MKNMHRLFGSTWFRRLQCVCVCLCARGVHRGKAPKNPNETLPSSMSIDVVLLSLYRTCAACNKKLFCVWVFFSCFYFVSFSFVCNFVSFTYPHIVTDVHKIYETHFNCFSCFVAHFSISFIEAHAHTHTQSGIEHIDAWLFVLQLVTRGVFSKQFRFLLRSIAYVFECGHEYVMASCPSSQLTRWWLKCISPLMENRVLDLCVWAVIRRWRNM